MLAIQHLTCRKGSRTLFSDLSFRVGAGEVLHVRGDNGCGKTSLLRLLAGFARPDAGTILRDDRPLDARHRQTLGWLGPQAALKDDLTVLENLRLQVSLAGCQPADTLLASLLQAWELARQAGLPARALSQGQRKRLAFAALEAMQRPLWLLDEPFNALDTRGCQQVWHAISTHAAAGGCVVMTHHAELPGQGMRELRLGERR